MSRLLGQEVSGLDVEVILPRGPTPSACDVHIKVFTRSDTPEDDAGPSSRAPTGKGRGASAREAKALGDLNDAGHGDQVNAFDST